MSWQIYKYRLDKECDDYTFPPAALVSPLSSVLIRCYRVLHFVIVCAECSLLDHASELEYIFLLIVPFNANFSAHMFSLLSH